MMNKFRVGYREQGEDSLGCHRGEWVLLNEIYDTREQAIEALKKDMENYKRQWSARGITAFDVDGLWWVEGLENTGWYVRPIDNGPAIASMGGGDDFPLDASCEWNVFEYKS